MFICVYQNNTFHPDSQENSIVYNYIVYFTEVYHPNTCYSGFHEFESDAYFLPYVPDSYVFKNCLQTHYE